MTADKDDPRFDQLYASGNVARLFIALLVPDLPSYMALGFEIRDRTLAWVIDAGRSRRHLCVANLDADRPTMAFGVPCRPLTDPPPCWLPVFSTADSTGGDARSLRSNGHQWIVDPLEPGECQVYRSQADK